MTKQTFPSEKDLRIYSVLYSKAISRMVGAKVDIKLEPFGAYGHITKSYLFWANTQATSSDDIGSVNIPSKVTVKHYFPGFIRTSETGDTTEIEYRTEKAVLELDIHLNGGRGERVRVYPELYSREVPECDPLMVLFREFIPGENLEQIAEKQIKEGGLKWEAAIGMPAISDSLYPIALLHTKTPIIAKALRERQLLQFETPEGINPLLISDNRARKFIRYCSRLVNGLGEELDKNNTEKLGENSFEIDRKFISKKDLLSIIDGELDVFPHHAMLKRLTDAGGVEIGGFVRDLAVYSAPIFRNKWRKPEDMPQTVLPAYLNIRRQFEENLRYPSIQFDEELLAAGILFASFMGNIRKATCEIHYKSEDKDYPREEIEKIANLYLQNAFNYIEAFIGLNIGRENVEKAKKIKEVLEEQGLGIKEYKLQPPKSEVQANGNREETKSRFSVSRVVMERSLAQV